MKVERFYGPAARHLLVLAGLGFLFAGGCSDSGKQQTAPVQSLNPVITSLVPARTVPGDTLTIEGSGFGNSGVILFTTSAGTVEGDQVGLWSDGRVAVRVPAGATSGPVVVRAGETQSDPADFAVAPARSFSADVQPLFEARCSSCHGPESPQQNLVVLTRDGLLRGGLNGPAVVPRHSATSLVVRKLRGEAVGARMPQGGPYLSDDDILKVADWIDQGARNN